MEKEWTISRQTYEPEKRQGMEPVFTLGNGFIGCRGFFEEETNGLSALGGIYLAGVFGAADYTPWKGEGRELANTPNFLYAPLCADGEQVRVDENCEDFNLTLQMNPPVLTRSYIWNGKSGTKIKVEFERFISGADIHLAGQKISITVLSGSPKIELLSGINAEIQNLNLVSSEPLPVQPGRKHIEVLSQNDELLNACIRKSETVYISEAQQISLKNPENTSGLTAKKTEQGILYSFYASQNIPIVFHKLAAVFVSRVSSGEAAQGAKNALKHADSYEQAFERHRVRWQSKWFVADIRIACDDGSDQAALRYNMLQLMQACPEHDAHLSIGARGITGEMYESCVFWDTEIFMLPFFTFTNPSAARKLLEFRYHTLPESRLHAQRNWFSGAMYGWQVSEKGIEQTPAGVGAYYSIHIVADIAYAIMEYWNAARDEKFMVQMGAEILIETARFWVSRVHRDEATGLYNLLAVRGPNEYDVIVNNNLYTNLMAQQNLILALRVVRLLQTDYPADWKCLCEKLSFALAETDTWNELVQKIVTPYDEAQDLYEEDDMYFKRVPLDMKRAKPTTKRIIDTTIPYEGLMLYQVSKQADVLHVMKNLPWRFTKQQVKNAWDYYVPKTCFDSSLSYSIHALMGARLGLDEQAHRFFDISANLDLRDVQLNTISGLHFANFGGTWQAAIFGFAGVNMEEDCLRIAPHLPVQWQAMSFRLWYRENLLELELSHSKIKARRIQGTGSAAKLQLAHTACTFDDEHNTLETDYNENFD